ncbi:hypothetical protein ABZ916_23465 [Streptomyces sp. NPDC046853]|uniref:hypothetical protein n=1 Tax=Streptomyces sp. NPDC046853 TaxID=3154920 RepID=UPI0033EDEB2E
MRRDASAVVTARVLGSAEVPAGVLDVVRAFWDMSEEPSATLDDSASPERLDRWAEELLARHGFGTAAFMFTGLGLAPWLELRVAPGWFASVRRADEASWVLLRGDFGAVAAVSEQEYRFEFYVAGLA